MPINKTEYAENIYWVYGIVLKDEVPFEAKEIIMRLGELKVGSRPFFWPMHEQPVFKKIDLFKHDSCPAASRLARRGFYIPSGLNITDEEIENVADRLSMAMKY